MTPLRPVSTHLERRARTAGGTPLLTHYGPAGERTELSGASFANWVAKTVNLLDDLGVAAGDVVDLPVLAQRPAHWMALVWPFALWQAGLAVTLGAPDADLAVVGPAAPRPLAPLTVACSLDAWARPCADLPAGVTDFSSEALAQPDAAALSPAAPDALAWRDEARTLTVADVAALPPSAERLLAAPLTPWEAVAALASAVLGGGSAVLVEPGVDPRRVAAAEHARVVA